MAFNRSRLKAVGPGVWTYKTDDAHTTVDGAGYFNDDGSVLKQNDVIFVVVVTNIDASNEAVSTYGTHIVNSVVRGNPDVIDTSNVTTGTVTDSD